MLTLLQRLNSAVPFSMQLAFVIRVVAATVLGAAIGFERTKRLKEAGIRTHCLVCAASALIMILSKYAFADLTLNGMDFAGTNGADPARLAAQIVSGISFICLAVIYRNGSSLKGLTTAAGIWATAAIGMTVGAGFYFIAIAVTLLIILLQSVMHHFNIGNDSLTTRDVSITTKDNPEVRQMLKDKMSLLNAAVSSGGMHRNGDGTVTYRFTVKFSREFSFEQISNFLDNHPDVIGYSI